VEKISNFIGGRHLPPVSGNYLQNTDPSTGLMSGEIPDSGPEDLAQAVAAARAVEKSWAATSSEERAAILLKISNLIIRDKELLARAESIDSGKTLEAALNIEIPRAAQNFEFYAHGATQFASESHAMGQSINYTLRQPLGTVACISPWNLPLYLFTWKIAPALAVGNCVIAKPSEITPVTAWMFGKICQEAGLPDGVLNILHGRGSSIGRSLVSHPAVKAIGFTGGTKTGAEIAAAAAATFKKTSLELGGKNPYLVFSDCNMEEAVTHSVRAAFSNQGQICLCGSRVYVQKDIYEEFKARFLEEAGHWQPGDPLDRASRVGAVVSRDHLHKILSYLETAREEGGRILTGGKVVRLEGRCENGYFIQPAVIEGLGQDSRLNQEEIFGPVVTLQPFATEEEALAMANDCQYGLSASVWTSNLQRAHRLGAELEAGIIWINSWLLRDLRTPFGGHKMSGQGCPEGGYESMRFFTSVKNVCINFA